MHLAARLKPQDTNYKQTVLSTPVHRPKCGPVSWHQLQVSYSFMTFVCQRS